jgi:hypothetical protein
MNLNKDDELEKSTIFRSFVDNDSIDKVCNINIADRLQRAEEAIEESQVREHYEKLEHILNAFDVKGGDEFTYE